MVKLYVLDVDGIGIHDHKWEVQGSAVAGMQCRGCGSKLTVKAYIYCSCSRGVSYGSTVCMKCGWGIPDDGPGTCEYCNGMGEVNETITCSHGYTDRHNYCNHGYTYQHDN